MSEESEAKRGPLSFDAAKWLDKMFAFGFTATLVRTAEGEEILQTSFPVIDVQDTYSREFHALNTAIRAAPGGIEAVKNELRARTKVVNFRQPRQ